MTRFALLVLLLTLIPKAHLVAQEHMHGEGQEHEHTEGHDAAVKSVVPLHERVRGYLIAAAEQMPESDYSYRPSDEVRNFGQVVGHLANAQYMFCGTISGGESTPPENFEMLTSKSDLVEALKMGFAQCDAAYSLNDAQAMQELEFFGNTGTKLWGLAFHTAHNWEHYGTLATYMRATGHVPPSSQGGM